MCLHAYAYMFLLYVQTVCFLIRFANTKYHIICQFFSLKKKVLRFNLPTEAALILTI